MTYRRRFSPQEQHLHEQWLLAALKKYGPSTARDLSPKMNLPTRTIGYLLRVMSAMGLVFLQKSIRNRWWLKGLSFDELKCMGQLPECSIVFTDEIKADVLESLQKYGPCMSKELEPILHLKPRQIGNILRSMIAGGQVKAGKKRHSGVIWAATGQALPTSTPVKPGRPAVENVDDDEHNAWVAAIRRHTIERKTIITQMRDRL